MISFLRLLLDRTGCMVLGDSDAMKQHSQLASDGDDGPIAGPLASARGHPRPDKPASSIGQRSGFRLFRSGSGFAWKSEPVAGTEFGHVAHNIIRFFCIEARVS
jgi:hypothetical protein